MKTCCLASYLGTLVKKVHYFKYLVSQFSPNELLQIYIKVFLTFQIIFPNFSYSAPRAKLSVSEVVKNQNNGMTPYNYKYLSVELIFYGSYDHFA